MNGNPKASVRTIVVVALAIGVAVGCTDTGPDEELVSSVTTDEVDESVSAAATSEADSTSDEIRGAELGPVVATGDDAGRVGETLLDKARRENATGKNFDADIARKDEEAVEKALAKLETAAGVLPITFKTISSYEYEEPKPGKPETLKKDQVPAEVRALHGKPVTMIGYMVPLDLTADHKVKLFFLASNTQACCFGQYPSIHEVVEVRVEDGAKYHKDQPVIITGKFEVGEEFDEYGYLLSLYRVEATTVKAAWDR